MTLAIAAPIYLRAYKYGKANKKNKARCQRSKLKKSGHRVGSTNKLWRSPPDAKSKLCKTIKTMKRAISEEGWKDLHDEELDALDVDVGAESPFFECNGQVVLGFVGDGGHARDEVKVKVGMNDFHLWQGAKQILLATGQISSADCHGAASLGMYLEKLCRLDVATFKQALSSVTDELQRSEIRRYYFDQHDVKSKLACGGDVNQRSGDSAPQGGESKAKCASSHPAAAAAAAPQGGESKAKCGASQPAAAAPKGEKRKIEDEQGQLLMQHGMVDEETLLANPGVHLTDLSVEQRMKYRDLTKTQEWRDLMWGGCSSQREYERQVADEYEKFVVEHRLREYPPLHIHNS